MHFVYNIQGEESVKSFLQRHSYSKTTISAIKNNGALLVNGRQVTVRAMMHKGDQLKVQLPQEIPSENITPFDAPLNILFEDDFLIIVAKPAHQNIAPSKEHLHESLLEQVYAYTWQNNEVVPHIVTRLDRNTSGIVIFTKHGFIHHLMSQLTIDKRYLCICHGNVQDSNIIEAPIARHPESIIQRQVSPDGNYARTSYTSLKQKNGYSLCEVKLMTGRTHQIRVHFQHIGHSLVGDDLYGSSRKDIPRQLLQCYQVAFAHPITHEQINIVDSDMSMMTIFDML
ncbi:MAG TPA: RluA family pseudouridine synthase [Staphylococcus kloosii]|uniref:RNA pseudouridylate synthase n=1 Tax=Staphylococcus kloosii TaxID=29384 RepID=A0A921KWD5_9STAP|nr:RluA family pseudouridine synthase [Staphylococcus kloosii]HJF68587.1 RluA family pseudouridine synthase [Staphylococcus kloosii]